MTSEEIIAIAKDLNAIRIILKDSYLISQIKDYYENIWGDIYDKNDVDFMKQWSNEAYENRYPKKQIKRRMRNDK